MTDTINDFMAVRTRLRGEISYFPAKWIQNPAGGYMVEFLDGPHKGEKFDSRQVARG